MNKEIHAAFRAKLFQRGMTMQEVFDELARLVATDDRRLIKILDEYAKQRVIDEIARLKRERPERERIGELDQDVLYDLITDE
jgi:hypothetical protein